MITKLVFHKIVPIMLFGLIILGCNPELNTSYPIETLSPTRIFTVEISTEELRSTIEPPNSTISSTQKPEFETATTAPYTFGSTLQLTFVSDDQHVYAVDINCEELENLCLGKPKLLFTWQDGISEINWSPDGKRIAFASGEFGGILYLSDWNGENAIQITEKCGAASWPQWSSDGTKVAFIFAPGKPGCEVLDYHKIQIYDTKTGQITDILNNVYDPNRIAWLPNSEYGYSAMKSNIDSTRHIYIVESDGKIIKQLPENYSEFSDIIGMTFSRDGQNMAFVGEIRPNIGKVTVDIYTGSVEGNKLINLTNGLGINLEPTWSPNFNWLAFESDRSGNYEIYLIEPDGTGLIQITHDISSSTNPAWRILP